MPLCWCGMLGAVNFSRGKTHVEKLISVLSRFF